MFTDVNYWTDCFSELGYDCVDYCVQTKAHESEKEMKQDENEDDDHTETDEDADSEKETEAEGRFGSTRTVPDSCITKKKNFQSI